MCGCGFEGPTTKVCSLALISSKTGDGLFELLYVFEFPEVCRSNFMLNSDLFWLKSDL